MAPSENTLNVQIFGTQKSHETKKALRFFKERGVAPQFIDLGKGKTAPGELGRFVAKVGVSGLIDKSSRAFQDSDLPYLKLTDEALLQRLLASPKLLVQPLVRSGNVTSVGWDETLWSTVYKDATRV